MKIRTDFVTNSSSSSFVIMTKENYTTPQLRDVLMEALNMPSSTAVIFPHLGLQIANVLALEAKDIDIHDYMEDYVGVDKISDMKDQGLESRTIYENYTEYPYIKIGFVSNESDEPLEVMLMDEEINFKNDKIILVKNGGY